MSDPIPQADPVYPQSPQPPGRRRMSRLLLWIILLVSGSMVVCCGGGLLFSWYLFKGLSTDPAVVRSTAAAIAQIDLPDPYQPLFSFERFGTRTAAFGSGGGADALPLLMLVEVPAGTELKPEQMATYSGNTQDGSHRITIHQTRQQSFQIQGKAQTVSIAEGVDGKGNKVVQVMAPITSASGKPGALFLLERQENFTEERLQQLLSSLASPAAATAPAATVPAS